MMVFSSRGLSSSCSGSTVKISLVSFFFLVKLYLIGYLPSFLMVITLSFGSPTRTAPKSSAWLSSLPMVTVGEILKASAWILMTLTSCWIPRPSVSSTSSLTSGSNLSSSLASKTISMTYSWHGFKVPLV